MISIVNVGPQTSDPGGERNYELRINEKVLSTFKHHRRDGLADCLRKAAHCAEKAVREDMARELSRFFDE